ncbi:MAG TPA: fumarylacetoacetate hydrolase family protein [Firmicutes bacterium]|nr:fumarylacetoacetate hydrolase family protein [Bacillota bacterium]
MYNGQTFTGGVIEPGIGREIIVDLQAAYALYLKRKGEPDPVRLAEALMPGDMVALLKGGERCLSNARIAVELVSEMLSSGAAAGLTGLDGRRLAYDLEEVRHLAPLPNPTKLICIGLNYRDHAMEIGAALPKEPVLFSKFSNAVIGPGEAIIIPEASREIDYEAELACIIGKAGKNIPRERALEHVAGYTILNDVSARDLQFRDGQWIKGKTLDSFAPMGPYLVTADEVGDPGHLDIKLWLNDKLMQDSNTDQLIFDVPGLIEYISRLMTLTPGDVIATGTPSGVGFKRKPPVFMKDGDVVRIQVEKLGVLTNPVSSSTH